MSCVKSQLVPVDPLAVRPIGVVSLLDVLKFYAQLFVDALWQINEIEAKWHPNDGVIPNAGAVAGKLSALQLLCAEHQLDSAARKCGLIVEKCRTKSVTFREAVTDLKHLRENLQGDLEKEMFLHLSPAQAEAYTKPAKDWVAVVHRFGKIRNDIEESLMCFALERYAASVFHIMLVAEFGVIEVAKLFHQEGDKPGWGCLEKLERVSDKKWDEKSPLEQQHSKFLKDLLPLAFAMKDSWRHKMDHVDNKIVWIDTDFSPRVAEDIIAATRGFMHKLASDLPT